VCEQGKYTVRVNARPMDYQFIADKEPGSKVIPF